MKFEWIGGRRFFLTLVCVAAATILCLLSKLTGGEWVAAILGTAAAYIGGDTYQHTREAKYETELAASYPRRNESIGNGHPYADDPSIYSGGIGREGLRGGRQDIDPI